MTPEQIERNTREARRCARHDWAWSHTNTQERAAWWVGELSYKLGIVDHHGMVDVDGEIARDFKRRYTREYNACARAPGWPPGSVG